MAVYTEVGDDELASFLADYDIGALLSYKGIAEGVENTNYVLTTDRGSFILTLYEKRVAREDLPFFLGLMDHLAAKDVPCPTPVHSRAGPALGELAGRPAALIVFLDGIWVRRPAVSHCRALGAALARLHLAGVDFALTRRNALAIDSWRILADQSADNADDVAPGLMQDIGAEIEALEAAWPGDLPSGVIHADLFPDNVFFIGERLSGLIDFYFACNDFFAYDIAICLNAWCFETDGSFNITKARALLAAYQSVRPVESAEFAAMPVLARGAALRFLLTRLYDWVNTPQDALVRPKDPMEYLRKLRFHRSVASASEYGLDARGDG